MSAAVVTTRDPSPTSSVEETACLPLSTSNKQQQSPQQQQHSESPVDEHKAFPKLKNELDETRHHDRYSPHNTNSAATADTTETVLVKPQPKRLILCNNSSPLPAEAKRILTQVAQTGQYTHLPWSVGSSSHNLPRKRPRTETQQHQKQDDYDTNDTEPSQYTSLQQVLRVSVQAVLEFYYYTKGGYKLAPVERLRHRTSASSVAPLSTDPPEPTSTTTPETTSITATLEEQIFRQRLQRLLSALEQPSVSDGHPPFTVQRIAEVLVAPERYYTQTHKLCNCLEKLFLVTASADAFGGMDGGDTAQTRKEAQERAALEDEKSRFHSHYLRRQHHQQLQQQSPSPPSSPLSPTTTKTAMQRYSPEVTSPEHAASGSPDRTTTILYHSPSSPSPTSPPPPESSAEDAARELLEAAARASLRTKFDHVGLVDQGNHKRDVAARMMMSESSRGLTNSPPPPSVSSMAVAAHLTGHGSSLLRTQQHHHHEPSTELGRALACTSPTNGATPTSPSSLIFPEGMHTNHLSMLRGTSVSGLTPLELAAFSATDLNNSNSNNKDADLESRSSASSDIDSESDDISLDDSASDRSDGSSDPEPSTTRAMVWRQQQQQRLSQSQRLQLWSSLQVQQQLASNNNASVMNSSNANNVPNSNTNEGGESEGPPQESRTDDSGGSDSSMSDMTD
ncbi:hypothetical protein FisN_21Hh018 [Fistulifera solaris]|uniref:Uncharacterized protein n=1 Tax=Fistulifera solaris TaxID=1519565 RepID=A0A1Z5KAS0_FISSO|nr:hypothetical protein FisN_21Hh018 [Fistulifera solaris]|eukprot:GAX23296.1 hypothetical protein FisN_21Hh018 [Fistulifera solaris]